MKLTCMSKSFYTNEKEERDVICVYDCTTMSFGYFSYLEH